MKPLDTSPPDPPEFCHPEGHKTSKSQQHGSPLYPGGTLVTSVNSDCWNPGPPSSFPVPPLGPRIATEDCTKLLSRGWQLQGGSPFSACHNSTFRFGFCSTEAPSSLTLKISLLQPLVCSGPSFCQPLLSQLGVALESSAPFHGTPHAFLLEKKGVSHCT